MAPDTPRILELRRRLISDPSSIAFAPLAEDLRRAGMHDEAIELCRIGLARHPAYLSARVTLGRALLELGRIDQARDELSVVVESASDNLTAIRGLAEIHQQRGEMAEALGYYRRALELARHDPELEATVIGMEQQIAPAPPPEAPVSGEALFDFDRLVEQLGAETPPGVQALDDATLAQGGAVKPFDSQAAALLPAAGEADALASLEANLRANPPDPNAPGPADKAALADLENWLESLRSPRP